MDGFRYVGLAQEVIFSSGSLARLAEVAAGYGWQRLMLCANRSLRENGRVASLQESLGDRLVVVFDQVMPHVQDFQVEEAQALAAEMGVQAVIGMGGGSPIGMAKAVAFALEEQPTPHPPHVSLPGEPPRVPVIAIPTTYAGSEMTAQVGITHTRETPPRKITLADPRIAPKLVLYDPALTLDLPPEMTASTGINALAHCIEALYSPRRYPLSGAAAVRAVSFIHSALLTCYQHGQDLNARTDMLLGAHLAGAALSGVTLGLHHGLCHVLGGSANVPHGIANAIILPHAIRFNAEATAPLLLPAAEAMGISVNLLSPLEAVETLAQEISDLVSQMHLPRGLRDAGVKENDLARLAELAFQNRTVQNNPASIPDAASIENLLRKAW